MRKTLLLLASLLIATSASAAIDSKINFEGAIPSTFSTADGSSIELSNLRFKDGSQSLRWQWSMPSELHVADYASLVKSVNARKGGIILWIYNPKAVDDDLHFEFLSTSGEAEYHFDFHLDFTGWRACWMKYVDMGGRKSTKTITKMVVKSPQSLNSGELFIDRLTFNDKPMHDQITPDQQIPNNNNTLKRNMWHWCRLWEWEQYEQQNELCEITPENSATLEQMGKRLTEIIEASMSSPQYIKGTIIPRAMKKWEAAGIRRLEDGTMTGAPYLSNDECNRNKGELRIDDFENMCYAFALDYHLNSNNAHIEKFFLAMDHAIEQGFAYGSGMGTNHHYGYNVRKLYNAAWLMRKEIVKRGKLEEYVKVLAYWSGLAECRRPYVYGRDELLDSWHTLLMPKVISAMLQPTEQEQWREMKNLSIWLSGSLSYTPGTIGGIKVDGTTFHHGGLYPNYSTGAFAAIGYFCKLTVDTPFQLEEEGRRCFKHALLTMDFYTNDRAWGLGVAGRHPLSKIGRIPDADVNAFGYLALQGDLTGSGKRFDPELAGAFLRMKGTDRKLYPIFKGDGISQSENPTGFLVLNYGAVGIHRRGDWMLTLKGYNSDVWCSEIYTRDNRYGRYQSYGTVQLIGSGAPVSAFDSGFTQEGWDWNRPPGATTIHLPYDLLDSPLPGTLMERNPERFSGVSSLEGRNGVLAAQYEEKERKNFTAGARAMKSAFCFDNRVVLLGSGITNNNSTYPTETTLYQLALVDPAEEVEFADNRYVEFPLAETRLNVERVMLSDTKGNYYIVKNAPSLTVVKQEQQSPDDKTRKMERGKFATAFISHGYAPQNAGYEYALYIQPTNKEINKIYKRDTYEVLQKDEIAHVVKDFESGITGYVCWREYNAQSRVLKIDGESIFMEREDSATGEWVMSICTPDLGITEKGYTTKQESQPIVKSVTLQGEWHLVGENLAIELLVESGNTIIKATCRHGKPIDFRLSNK